MKPKFLRILNSIIIIITVFIVSGCNSNDTIQNLDDKTQKTTITFAAIEAQHAEYAALIAEFEVQNPDIDVKFVNLAVDPSNMIGFATQADAIALPVVPVGSDAYTYLDIQPLAETDTNYDQGQYLPGIMEGCQVDERQIGLPYTASLQVIYYNRDIFDAAGIAYPQPDWTWEEFRLNTINLTRRNGQEVEQYGFVNLSSMVRLLGTMLNRDLKISDEEEKAGALEKTLSSYLNLIQQGYVRIVQADEYPGDLETIIREGKAAMWLDGLFQLDAYRNALGKQISFLPVPEGGRASARCVAISAGSQQPQAAWRWIRFLSEQDGPYVLPNELPAYQEMVQKNVNWHSFSEDERAVLQTALDKSWYGTHWLFATLNQEFDNVLADQNDLNSMLSTVLQYSPPEPEEPFEPQFAIQVLSTPDDIPPGAVYVKFSSGGYLNREVREVLVNEFNQNQTDYYIYTNVAPEEADCFIGNQSENQPEAYYPLTPLLEGDAESMALAADLPPGVLETTRRNREILGIPLFILAYATYYNPVLLEQTGLEPPPADWTFAEFWEYAQTATQEGIYGFGLGSPALVVIYDSLNSPLIDESGEVPVFLFNTPEVKQTTEFLLKMQYEGVIPELDIDMGDKYWTWRKNILSGKAVFWMSSMDDYLNEELKYEPGMVPIPGYIPNYSLASFPSFFISKNSSDPEGCWEWFKYFSTNPAIYSWIPLRNSVRNSPEYEALVGTDMASLYRNIIDQMKVTPIDEKSRDTSYFTTGPYFWFQTTIGALKYGEDLDIPLQTVQFKSEAYLTCMLNMDGTPGENYQTCMKLVDPDS
ncbi:MAG: extracellular solute-binding protein [Anaerolineaceae bacterium]|nr:extracellular solute-binding protein [Anaerolineaceae bacterium]